MKICDDLRQAVLQAAIQGKLTRQLPEDGDARDLLAEIAKEKARLIKEKKIKKEKPLAPITDDEVPFDVPDNWVWARLDNIIYGTDAGKSPQCINEPRIGNGFGVIKTTAVQQGLFLENENKVLPTSFQVKEEYLIRKGDLLITRAGPQNRTGVTCVVQIDVSNLILSDKTVRINYSKCVLPEYIMLFLESPSGKENISGYMTGMASSQVNISQGSMRKFIISLPPLAEQHRIVARVDKLMAEIDDLEKVENQLVALKDSFPGDMKAALLQPAMQGKLTTQRAEDGNAKDLLAAIAKEKAKLIKEKKIKKEKPLAPITEDEIPFDIPENWEWVRLGNVISLQSGQDLAPDKYNASKMGIPYITGASNINNNLVEINRWTENPRAIASQGDLLLTCKGTVGKMAYLMEDKAHIARQIMSIKSYNGLLLPYVRIFLTSQIEELKAKAKSMIPGIAREDVLNSIIPVPPLAEQQRIVAKLDKLLPLCERLVEK